MNALCIAIYGMFIAIVAPDTTRSKPLLCVVAVSIALSCLFYYLPALDGVSGGISVSVCAVAAALLGAFIFPVKEEDSDDR